MSNGWLGSYDLSGDGDPNRRVRSSIQAGAANGEARDMSCRTTIRGKCRVCRACRGASGSRDHGHVRGGGHRRDPRLNRFAASFIGADTDGFPASITEDMVIMPPDEPRVSGHDAIRAWLDGFFAAYKTDLEYTGSDVTLGGDVAFESYTFRWTLTPLVGGEEIRQTGKGMYVFRRQVDGSWRVARDIWNYTPEG